jgi:hypothetical protein
MDDCCHLGCLFTCRGTGLSLLLLIIISIITVISKFRVWSRSDEHQGDRTICYDIRDHVDFINSPSQKQCRHSEQKAKIMIDCSWWPKLQVTLVWSCPLNTNVTARFGVTTGCMPTLTDDPEKWCRHGYCNVKLWYTVVFGLNFKSLQFGHGLRNTKVTESLLWHQRKSRPTLKVHPHKNSACRHDEQKAEIVVDCSRWPKLQVTL